MNQSFHIDVKIGKQIIYIEELKLKQYKIIQKALLGIDTNFKNVITNITSILTEITTLKHKELIELNYIDFILLLLYIRSISFGNIIEAYTAEVPPLEIKINIENIISKIDSLQFDNHLEPFIVKNIPINLRIPTINDIISIEEKNNQFKTVLLFTEFSNTLINDDLFLEVLEQLPVNIFLEINKKIKDLAEYINSINLLDYLPSKSNIKLPLTPNIKNISSVIKLLFNSNLITMYENIFALSKIANISPLYLEECTPGEYNIFINLLQSILKAQTTNKNQTIQNT